MNLKELIEKINGKCPLCGRQLSEWKNEIRCQSNELYDSTSHFTSYKIASGHFSWAIITGGAKDRDANKKDDIVLNIIVSKFRIVISKYISIYNRREFKPIAQIEFNGDIEPWLVSREQLIDKINKLLVLI